MRLILLIRKALVWLFLSSALFYYPRHAYSGSVTHQSTADAYLDNFECLMPFLFFFFCLDIDFSAITLVFPPFLFLVFFIPFFFSLFPLLYCFECIFFPPYHPFLVFSPHLYSFYNDFLTFNSSGVS